MAADQELLSQLGHGEIIAPNDSSARPCRVHDARPGDRDLRRWRRATATRRSTAPGRTIVSGLSEAAPARRPCCGCPGCWRCAKPRLRSASIRRTPRPALAHVCRSAVGRRVVDDHDLVACGGGGASATQAVSRSLPRVVADDDDGESGHRRGSGAPGACAARTRATSSAGPACARLRSAGFAPRRVESTRPSARAISVGVRPLDVHGGRSVDLSRDGGVEHDIGNAGRRSLRAA